MSITSLSVVPPLLTQINLSTNMPQVRPPLFSLFRIIYFSSPVKVKPLRGPSFGRNLDRAEKIDYLPWKIL